MLLTSTAKHSKRPAASTRIPRVCIQYGA